MEEGIQASMAEGKSFAEAVRTTLCNYRATQHALTGTSPAELMIGRKLILSLDNLKPLKLLNMRLPLRRSNTLPLSRKHWNRTRILNVNPSFLSLMLVLGLEWKTISQLQVDALPNWTIRNREVHWSLNLSATRWYQMECSLSWFMCSRLRPRVPTPVVSSMTLQLKLSLIRIWINLRRTMILLVCPYLIWSWKIHVLLLRVPSVTDVILLYLGIMKSISKYLM